jgi:hypothetical protein
VSSVHVTQTTWINRKGNGRPRPNWMALGNERLSE